MKLLLLDLLNVLTYLARAFLLLHFVAVTSYYIVQYMLQVHDEHKLTPLMYCMSILRIQAYQILQRQVISNLTFKGNDCM